VFNARINEFINEQICTICKPKKGGAVKMVITKQQRIIENEVYTPYFLILKDKPLKMMEIKKKINKSYSIVHKQINFLHEERYLKFFKKGYEINYEKLIIDFLYYIYRKGKPAHRNFLIEYKDYSKIEKNELIIEMFRTSLDYISNEQNREYMLTFIGNKKIDELTLSDIFYSISRVLIKTDLSDEISNKYDFKKKCSSLIQFEEIIEDIRELWLDYDEILENEIKENILNLIDKNKNGHDIL